ncbi:MAG TPA: 6-phosphogluconolactonase [Candidatus Binatia bacterium]
MEIRIEEDAAAVARAGAELVARAAREAIAARGAFHFAVSGGRTPWEMMRELVGEDIAWDKVHVFQVDERIAPEGDPDRNMTHLRASLLAYVRIPPGNVHAMPVERDDPEAAAADYARTLAEVVGSPPVLDLVHLGLGPDGHTASLVPGDAVLEVTDRDVAVTSSVYQGRRRMTLTYPVLERAREVMWLVDGAAKAEMLARLVAGDETIPAGRVHAVHATAIVDTLAASQLRQS